MQPRDRTERWRAWVLAGSLALTVGVQASQPVLAKPGFGQDSNEQRDRERRAEERRQQERAEQGRRAEERRQQESKRESERQAERDRQGQERARREQHEAERRSQRDQQEAERRAQRERDQAKDAERRAQRDAEERAAREKQADRVRHARDAEQAARAQREQVQQARQRAAEERREAERQAQAAEQARRAERERARDTQTERRRPGFGIKDEAGRTDRDRAAREAAVREAAAREAAAREAAAREAAAREAAARDSEARDARRRAEERQRGAADRARPGFRIKEEALRAERDRREAERLRRENTEAVRRAERDREGQERQAERTAEAIRSGRIKDWGDGPGFGIKDPKRATREGSLDRYFNPRGGDFSYRPDRTSGRDRDRERQRNRAYRVESGRRDRYERDRYYRDRYYRDRYYYDRYGRRYDRYDDCLYDVIYIPVPGPVIIHERVDTEIVRVPEPVTVPVPGVPETSADPLRPEEPAIAATPVSPSERLARMATLTEVIDDIEQAWLTENLALLMQYVRRDANLEIYRDGRFSTALRRDEFEMRTAEAFRRYETVALRFAAPRSLSATEAAAAAEHRYREPDGRERRARVVYAFIKEDDAWWIAGIDTVRLERQGALPQARPAIARSGSPAVVLTRVSMQSAPRLRGTTLRAQSRPMRVATLRAVVNGRPGLYDLKAMRGLRPDTLAWGLYRRGQARPLETGTVTTSRLRTASWVSVRLSRRTAQVRNARALALPAVPAGTVVLPIRSLSADTVLALGPTAASKKGKATR